jgi:hypothetical protein
MSCEEFVYIIKSWVVMLTDISLVNTHLLIKSLELLCPCYGYKSKIGPRHSKFKAKLTKQSPTEDSKGNIKISSCKWNCNVRLKTGKIPATTDQVFLM